MKTACKFLIIVSLISLLASCKTQGMLAQAKGQQLGRPLQTVTGSLKDPDQKINLP